MDAYATRAQLAGWLLGVEDPSDPRMPAEDDANRLLARASEDIETKVLAGYRTNSLGQPADADVAAWLADATCAQVEFMLLVSEEHTIAGVTTGTMSAGGVSHDMPQRVGPRPLAILDRAGLRRIGGYGTTRYRRPLDLIGRTYTRGTNTIIQTTGTDGG